MKHQSSDLPVQINQQTPKKPSKLHLTETAPNLRRGIHISEKVLVNRPG
jgi:hypothetical protein